MEFLLKDPNNGKIISLVYPYGRIQKENNLLLFLCEIFDRKINSFMLFVNNKLSRSSDPIKPKQCASIYQMIPKLLGGKGGFGSLLKGQPAVKSKTKNFDSCRDLSGRRLRQINQEKTRTKFIEKREEEDRIINEYTLREEELAIPKSSCVQLSQKTNKFKNNDNQIANLIDTSVKYLRKKRGKVENECNTSKIDLSLKMVNKNKNNINYLRELIYD